MRQIAFIRCLLFQLYWFSVICFFTQTIHEFLCAFTYLLCHLENWTVNIFTSNLFDYEVGVVR